MNKRDQFIANLQQKQKTMHVDAQEIVRQAYLAGQTQETLLDSWCIYLHHVAETPTHWIYAVADRYFNEIYRCIKNEKVRTLFCHEGQLYRRTADASPEIAHLPTWNEIPRDSWSLARGARYWIYADKDPVLFFQPD